MRLDELKWQPHADGSLWLQAKIRGAWRIYKRVGRPGCYDGTELGEYLILRDDRAVTGVRRGLDPITAQALLFHYLGGNDAAE